MIRLLTYFLFIGVVGQSQIIINSGTGTTVPSDAYNDTIYSDLDTVTVTPRMLDSTWYLFKRGSSYTTTDDFNISDVQDMKISTFGTGAKPRLYHVPSGGFNMFSINSSDRIIIDSMHIEFSENTTSSVRSFNFYQNSDTNSYITVQNCEMEKGWVAMNMADGTDSVLYNHNITFRNNYVYHQGNDQYLIRAFNNLLIDGDSMVHCNQRWHNVDHTEASGGDCIQADTDYNNLKIYNCYFDRRNTGNKFCVILGDKDSFWPLKYVEIIGNEFHPPKDTIGDHGGCALYLQYIAPGSEPANTDCNRKVALIERNYFSGRVSEYCDSTQFAAFLQWDTIYMNYNIIDSINDGSGDANDITGDCDYAEFYNNTIVSISDSMTNVFGVHADVTIMRNNIAGGSTIGSNPLNSYSGDLTETNYLEKQSNSGTIADTLNKYLKITRFQISDFSRTSDEDDGVDVGISYDYDSTAVSNPPEIGALEYR